MWRLFFLIGLLSPWGQALPASTFFVSPNGNDSNPGTESRPLATLNQAQAVARHAKRPVTVYLRDGTYYLPQTLVLQPEDSGQAGAPVVWRAWKGERAVISGGQRLSVSWEPYRDGIVKAQVPEGFVSDQLFINGRKQILARYPNYDPGIRILNGYAADAISPERAARWRDPRGGFIHAMHEHLWGDFHYVITGKDASGHLTYEGGWQNNRRMGMHREYRFVENIFEELDAPGEWFLDRTTRTLYFMPPPGLDLAKATIEGVRLRHLVEFEGTEEDPVKFISLQGITFQRTACTFMDNKEPLLRSDWTTYRGGAVFFTGAEDCSVEDCVLDEPGGNAIFLNNYNRRVRIRGCEIARAGANGVAVVGDPKAVRSPLFEYNQVQELSALDRVRGPRTPNYPKDCIVEDCLIYQTGRVEKQTAGVEIAMAQNITVRHCSIYETPRAGINIGDGCWGGNVIEFCDVFDTVLETGDHGSFNSWGRDRFWRPSINEVNAWIKQAPELPLLDTVRPNVLRNNRWRCDHGWDIDLDDGSSNYEIRDNLCLNGGLKNREGFYRVVENNLIVNNSFHPHVWYADSQDVFRRNIVFAPYQPIRVNKPWGKECDFNLLQQAGRVGEAPAVKLQELSGRDEHSVVADALFVAPAAGDYRVKHGSPALKLGFRNFSMDRFGVESPRLKAIARRPELPRPDRSSPLQPSGRTGRLVDWLGGKIKNVVGAGEISAAGLPGELGVSVVVAPEGSKLFKAGLREGDVILKYGTREVNNVDDLLQAFAAVPSGRKVKLEIYRAQRKSEVEL